MNVRSVLPVVGARVIPSHVVASGDQTLAVLFYFLVALEIEKVEQAIGGFIVF
jgi:hypothetical protein